MKKYFKNKPIEELAKDYIDRAKDLADTEIEITKVKAKLIELNFERRRKMQKLNTVKHWMNCGE